MSVSLYDASVAGFLQSLQGATTFLEKARVHFEQAKIDLDAIVEARIHPDMFPLRFQIVSLVHHSLGAVEGVKKGLFTPPTDRRPHNYADLQKLVADAHSALGAYKPNEIDALQGRPVTFEFGDVKLPFSSEHFLLSFSMPNLHFHATTAYDILRAQGAPLGKRDYLGPLRLSH